MGQLSTRIFLKYLALQIPGWILLVGILLVLRSQVELPVWAGATILMLWIVKDLVLYPFLRHAYEDDPRTGAERLVGSKGVAATPIAPVGFIHVRGELWRAEARASARVIPEGTTVKVCGARGLTLSVERD